MEKGMNVITSAEEMAYPQAQEPELAKKLDECAKKNGVSVMGTGINPGLIMDLLVILWTAACEEVNHITSRRVNSLSPFGPAVMEEQAISYVSIPNPSGVLRSKRDALESPQHLPEEKPCPPETMMLKKFMPSLYSALGVYLPLITTNCAVLGVCIASINEKYAKYFRLCCIFFLHFE